MNKEIKEEMNIFVRYKRSAPGNQRAITIDGIPARLFERGIPMSITESEKKIIDDKYSDLFEAVETEKDLDVPVKKTKPHTGIVSEKELNKEDTDVKPYDPAKDKDRDVTKEEAYALNMNEQKSLLDARDVKYKSTDKEQTLVNRILKSNPGYKE